MALLMARDIIKSHTVILLAIVLRAVISYITKPIFSDTFTILYSIVVLIVLKVLSNIVVTVKELIIVELIIY